ncbi:MAG: hypothetical protein ABW061_26245, partial [Polyangiaceae bacterium]
NAEQMRATDLLCLAQRAIEALGVGENASTGAEIMEHSIAQACLELEAVERVLDCEQGEIGGLVYIVAGIRQRLAMAQHSAPFLATVLAEGRAIDAAAAAKAQANQ